MTAIEAAWAQLAQAEQAREAAELEVYMARLAVEVASGRPESHTARFARAVLMQRSSEIQRLALESDAEYRLRYPERQAEREAQVAAVAAEIQGRVSP